MTNYGTYQNTNSRHLLKLHKEMRDKLEPCDKSNKILNKFGICFDKSRYKIYQEKVRCDGFEGVPETAFENFISDYSKDFKLPQEFTESLITAVRFARDGSLGKIDSSDFKEGTGHILIARCKINIRDGKRDIAFAMYYLSFSLAETIPSIYYLFGLFPLVRKRKKEEGTISGAHQDAWKILSRKKLYESICEECEKRGKNEPGSRG